MGNFRILVLHPEDATLIWKDYGSLALPQVGDLIPLNDAQSVRVASVSDGPEEGVMVVRLEPNRFSADQAKWLNEIADQCKSAVAAKRKLESMGMGKDMLFEQLCGHVEELERDIRGKLAGLAESAVHRSAKAE